MLSDPALFSRDPAKAAMLLKQRATAAERLAAAEAKWLAALEDYETAVAES
jgi:ATP-binding cassette subfamily F protein 3